MPRLYVLSGAHIGATHDFTHSVDVGRAVADGVTLKSGSISRRHARFEEEGGNWYVVDLGSSNGVFVGGERVERALVADGETFKLGDVEVRLRYATEVQAQRPAVQVQAQPQPAPALDPEPDPDPEPGIETETETGAELDISFPNQPDSPPDQSDDFDLEGDWDDSAPTPSAPQQAPAQKPAVPSRSRPAPTAAEKKTREQAGARAQAMGAAGGLAGQGRTAGGGKVLQYNRVAQRSGLFATDLSQHPAWVRFMAYLLVIAVFAGMVFGSFKLMKGLRDRGGQPATSEF